MQKLDVRCALTDAHRRRKNSSSSQNVFEQPSCGVQSRTSSGHFPLKTSLNHRETSEIFNPQKRLGDGISPAYPRPIKNVLKAEFSTCNPCLEVSKDTMTIRDDNETLTSINCNEINAIAIKTNRYLSSLSHPDFIQVKLENARGKLDLLALIDTGALHGDYISLEVEKIALELGFNSFNSDVMVCTAISNDSQCTPAKSAFILPVIFNDEQINQMSSFESTFTVIKTDYDMIIGRKSIKKYDLTSKMHSQFAGIFPSKHRASKQPKSTAFLNALRFMENAKINLPSSAPAIFDPELAPPDQPRKFTCDRAERISALQKESMYKFIDKISDAEGIPVVSVESPWQELADEVDSIDNVIPVKIFGNANEIRETQKLCTEFIDIFSTSLKSLPADVPPMEFTVDEKLWQNAKSNKLPPRPQSLLKQKETLRQVNIMLENNVIEPSSANRYAQVLLTPKPDDKFRFCVDFNDLHKCHEAEAWPIPNIGSMLQRVGEKRGIFFGVMDLTSGYHQTPLSFTAELFTAFITIFGLYH